ncbi:hypothetical protein HX109_12530 [Galbibacter sp. BG1]|uniref:hypothetical protein n=1 Tax=Galbibacter sp. BG1 TaxID=1170699 RepID=UPI0015B89D57|nr:hypothetical protein [Galbibacter sp. BG1]QLE02342.1 hypothetical protein HX109_12530 [Galbibacter sp. BG1]
MRLLSQGFGIEMTGYLLCTLNQITQITASTNHQLKAQNPETIPFHKLTSTF